MGRKKKQLTKVLKISGKTDDNRLVISGSLYFIHTLGMNLTDIIKILNNHNMVIDWFELIEDCNNFEHYPLKRLLNDIKESIIDSGLYNKTDIRNINNQILNYTNELENK